MINGDNKYEIIFQNMLKFNDISKVHPHNEYNKTEDRILCFTYEWYKW